MSDKPFPPSARRLALARQAGLTAASPLVVAGLAVTAVALVLASGRYGLGDVLAAACRGDARGAPDLDGALVHPAASLATTTIALAAPLLAAAAIAAIIAQLAQTRTLWLPRRSIAHAPALDRGAGARTRATAFDFTAVTVVGAVGLAWLWWCAPRLATLVELDPPALLGASCALGVSFLAALAIAFLVLGVIDAVARHLELASALAMTAAEKREDDRLTTADPRWARQRALATEPTAGVALAHAVSTCALVVLGDDLAIAIAWDATRQPVPTRVAVGHRARATQLVGLARRHRIAVHRDVTLARALAAGEGPVPEAHWRRLADVVAAIRRS